MKRPIDYSKPYKCINCDDGVLELYDNSNRPLNFKNLVDSGKGAFNITNILNGKLISHLQCDKCKTAFFPVWSQFIPYPKPITLDEIIRNHISNNS